MTTRDPDEKLITMSFKMDTRLSNRIKQVAIRERRSAAQQFVVLCELGLDLLEAGKKK
jgi:hypothetical protein